MDCVKERNIVFVDNETLLQAGAYVSGCERCASDPDLQYDFLGVAISFDYLLDAITGCDPTVTDYLMFDLPKCPRCSCELTEKTLVLTF
jgi:hypothetical protein